MTVERATVEAPAPAKRPRVTFGTFVIGLVVLVVAAATLFFSSGSSLFFPVLPTGTFTGKLELRGKGGSLPLYVESNREANTLLIGVLAPEWSPHIASTGNEMEGMGVPIIIPSPQGAIRLTGEESDGTFQGRLEVIDTGATGRWQLRPLLQTVDDSQGDDVALWLRLREELSAARALNSEQTRRIVGLEQKFDELSELVTDAGALREQTAKRDNQLNETLGTLKTEWKGRRIEMGKFADQVEGQRRVTGRGKLVQLSRDLIDRQDRWLDSMFRAHMSGYSGVSTEEMARAERVMQLRQAIAEERRRLGLGADGERTPGRQPAAPFSDIFRRGR